MPATIARGAGFTVIELIAVIVIAGILAITAAMSFDKRGYDAAATATQLRSIVSYAQKTAVASRRATRVSVSSGALVLEVCLVRMTETEICPTPGTNWTTLQIPNGGASFTPIGATLTLASAINFDTLGRPTDAAGRHASR